MKSICGEIESHDFEKWSSEKQHNLFNTVKIKNIKVYESLLTLAKTMNGHSLDLIKISVNFTWKNIIELEDLYIISMIIRTEQCNALFMDDEDFIAAIMKTPEKGKIFLDNLKLKYG